MSDFSILRDDGARLRLLAIKRERHAKGDRSTQRHTSVKLGEGCLVIGHMLENIERCNVVECTIVEGQAGYIFMADSVLVRFSA